MMSARIRITLLRPAMVGGARAEPGRHEVPALVAAALLSCGKAELCNPADEVALREAVHADTLAAIKKAGRPWQQPEPGPGWQRVNH